MQYDNTKQTRKLIDIFLSDEFSIEEEDLQKFFRAIVEYYKTHTRHQYHIISHLINEIIDDDDDQVSYLLNNIDAMLAFIKYRKLECDQMAKEVSEDKISAEQILLGLEKLYDHVALEEERIITNGKMLRKSKREVERNVIETFNSIMNDFQNKVDEISNSLNANIITVVGLFSAIIFVFFGGINTISEIVTGIWGVKTKQELTIPLIIILAVGFVIFNVVFLLLYSISKIVDKNIGTTVSGNSSRYYCVEELSEGCYGVFWGDQMFGKCYRSLEKAEKKAKRKNWWSDLKGNIQQIGKRIFFRFPYVVIINGIFVVGIIYLYLKL